MTALPGISDAITEINRKIQKVSGSNQPVFITGESGTEKAFAAKLIHSMSSRSNKALYKTSINNTLPSDFGQRFRQCHEGTLVLSIHKKIPADIQYVLIELTSGNSFSDPLTDENIIADVRFIITTGVDLLTMSKKSEILPELMGLIEKRRIEIPPLRDRPEDIPALVRYAISRAQQTGRTNVKSADAQVLALFRQWDWPGNAEDLLLVTAEACLQTKKDRITLNDLPEEFMEQVNKDMVEAAQLVKTSRTSPKALETNASIHSHDTEDELAPSEEIPERDTKKPSYLTVSEDQVVVDAARYKRLIMLARRLHSQSEILNKQMTGPIENISMDELLSQVNMADINADEVSDQLESELDRSLDSIMGLRRQLALLNEREQKTIATARDLYRRLILAGRDTNSIMEDEEVQQETAGLADSLREMDEVIQRVSGSFPKLGAKIEAKMAQSLAKDETEVIAKALKRAQDKDRENKGLPKIATEAEGLTEDPTLNDLIKFVQRTQNPDEDELPKI